MKRLKLARFILNAPQELHVVVIVALFVSLVANLIVAFYSANMCNWLTPALALAQIYCTWKYLPVAQMSSQLWQDAYSRGGMPPSKVVWQLTRLRCKEDNLITVAESFILTATVFLAALVSITITVLSLRTADTMNPSVVSQSLANAFVAGSLYALVGLSFSIIYAANRFFHFAHGAIFAGAAYTAYVVRVILNLPLLGAVAVAVVTATLIGCGLEMAVYHPLRKRRATGVVLLLASLGLYLVLQNLLPMFFGDDARSLRAGSIAVGISIVGARITPVQLWLIVSGIISLLVICVLLNFSKIGRMFRAVTCDTELANSIGVDTDRVILAAFAVGSGLAGLAGVLAAIDLDITPTMGLRTLMMGVIASVAGGVRSVPGAYVGGMLLGFAQHFGIWAVGTEWQDTTAFVVLIVFLAFRPEGFFGRQLRQARV